MNQLFFGDNLSVLHEHLKDESVDLIYLAPPFNSKRDYNLLFKSPKGHESEGRSQPLKRGEQAEREFDELVHAPNTDVSELMQVLRRFTGRFPHCIPLSWITKSSRSLHVRFMQLC